MNYIKSGSSIVRRSIMKKVVELKEKKEDSKRKKIVRGIKKRYPEYLEYEFKKQFNYFKE